MKKKAYVETIKEGINLVYCWSKQYNRFICTHMFPTRGDADETVEPSGRVVTKFRGYTYR